MVVVFPRRWARGNPKIAPRADREAHAVDPAPRAVPAGEVGGLNDVHARPALIPFPAGRGEASEIIGSPSSALIAERELAPLRQAARQVRAAGAGQGIIASPALAAARAGDRFPLSADQSGPLQLCQRRVERTLSSI
jgi:hypothetical protein